MKKIFLVFLCVFIGVFLLTGCLHNKENAPDAQPSDVIWSNTETDLPNNTAVLDTTEKQDETITPIIETAETTAAPESHPILSDDGGTRLPQVDDITQKNEDPMDRSYFGEWRGDKFISSRTVWNIEFSFVELTDKAIVIRICDNDNLGFVINDLYYKLEVLKSNEWVQLSKTNLDYAMKGEVGYVHPSIKNNYVDINSINLLNFLNDNTVLESGHYRITKVLSGKYFSYEFDLEI